MIRIYKKFSNIHIIGGLMKSWSFSLAAFLFLATAAQSTLPEEPTLEHKQVTFTSEFLNKKIAKKALCLTVAGFTFYRLTKNIQCLTNHCNEYGLGGFIEKEYPGTHMRSLIQYILEKAATVGLCYIAWPQEELKEELLEDK